MTDEAKGSRSDSDQAALPRAQPTGPRRRCPESTPPRILRFHTGPGWGNIPDWRCRENR